LSPNPIAKIVIENFQSHKKTEITPAPNGQLTVLTGPSDAGKTAIIRALRWLLYNIPQGTDFIRHGASFARVTAEYASGYKVIRERSRRGYNRYIIIDPAGERQVYEGFGNNVPLEVQLVTGVRPVIIGDMEFNLNISEQLDGPFLGKSVSAGARAKVLGKLAGTEEVDHAAKNLATDLYRKRQDEKRLAAEVQELEEKIRAYDYLDALGDRIAGVNLSLAQLKTDIELLEKLKKLAAAINETRELGNNMLFYITALTEHLEIIEPLLETVGQDITNRDRLKKLHIALFETRTALSRTKQTLADTAGADAAAGLVSRVERDHENLVRFQELVQKSNRNHTAVRHAKAIIEATKDAHLVDALIEDTWKTVYQYLRLTDLNEYLGDVQNRLQCAARILNITGPVHRLAELIIQVEQNVELFRKLLLLKNRLAVLNEGVNLIQRDLDATAQVDVIATLIMETNDQLNLLIKLSNKSSQLNIAKDMARIRGNDCNTITEHIKCAQQKYIDLLTSYGICPTCGSNVSPKKLKEVI